MMLNYRKLLQEKQLNGGLKGLYIKTMGAARRKQRSLNPLNFPGLKATDNSDLDRDLQSRSQINRILNP